jgi:hypothetical protein
MNLNNPEAKDHLKGYESEGSISSFYDSDEIDEDYEEAKRRTKEILKASEDI